MDSNQLIELTLIDKEGQSRMVRVPKGSNLRNELIKHNFSPYTSFTKNANCGGNGICATCGIWVKNPVPVPLHWHDKLAYRFGYPRLSCQITVHKSMTILQVDKWIWGKPKKEPI